MLSPVARSRVTTNSSAGKDERALQLAERVWLPALEMGAAEHRTPTAAANCLHGNVACIQFELVYTTDGRDMCTPSQAA